VLDFSSNNIFPQTQSVGAKCEDENDGVVDFDHNSCT